jgi:hypothetical protein
MSTKSFVFHGNNFSKNLIGNTNSPFNKLVTNDYFPKCSLWSSFFFWRVCKWEGQEDIKKRKEKKSFVRANLFINSLYYCICARCIYVPHIHMAYSKE